MILDLAERKQEPPSYHHFVRWSEKDQCYVGYCPGLYFGGVCHGECNEAVYAELCGIVRDEIAHRLSKGESLPAPQLRVTRSLEFAAA